ncbi:MAG: hypothetical protein IJQ23_02100, partial [Clostridia bacterium]|nr:hypothetical protein [Clostridia bacterium]
MKKVITIVLATLLSLSLFVAVGCGGDTKPCETHSYENGVCTVCGYVCPHDEYENGVCKECGKVCQHSEYENGVCKVCGKVCQHSEYENGVCKECGKACSHPVGSFYNGVCACGKRVCNVHTFVDGVCEICGTKLTYLAKNAENLTIDVKNGEQIYTYTKVAGVGCNSAENVYLEGANYIRNYDEKQFVKFEWYSDDFNYIQFISGTGADFYSFSTYARTKVIKSSDSTVVPLDESGSTWTGETLPKGEWLTMVVDVRGIYDLGFLYWSSESGTTQVKNIEFLDIARTTEDYMSFEWVDGEVVFSTIKVDGEESDNYGKDAVYFSIPENRNTITFDIKSEDFDYFKLTNGDGESSSEIDFAKKVVITEKVTGNKITTTEANSTGHVLELDKWYSVKVDVSGVKDLLLVYEKSAFGSAQIKNIQLNPIIVPCETHSYENSVCTACGTICPHEEYENGVCKECGYVCPHDEYENGVCKECGYVCPHDEYENGVCKECGYVCPHEEYENGV